MQWHWFYFYIHVLFICETLFEKILQLYVLLLIAETITLTSVSLSNGANPLFQLTKSSMSLVL